MMMQVMVQFAEDAAQEAIAMLHTHLKAPARSFQGRASLLGPVFQVAIALVQVMSAILDALLRTRTSADHVAPARDAGCLWGIKKCWSH